MIYIKTGCGHTLEIPENAYGDTPTFAIDRSLCDDCRDRPDDIIFVNEYVVNRAFGGPEEGGWWYDTGTFVKCHTETVDQGEAEKVVQGLAGYVERQNEGSWPTSSVLCSGVTRVYLQDEPGRDFPEYRPTYE